MSPSRGGRLTQTPTQSNLAQHQAQASLQANVSSSISIPCSTSSIPLPSTLEDMNTTNTQTLPSPPSSQASALPTYIIPDNNAFTFPIQQNTQTLHPSYIPATSSHHLYPQNNNNERNFPPNSTNTNDSMTQLPTKNSMTMRLIFQNVNGLPTTPKHPKLDSIQSFMALNQVDVMGVSEVNVAWHTIPTNNRLHSLTSEWFETRHLSIAWNTHEDPLSTRQIGGVALITTNSLTHQIIESGQDPTALGRWTWTRYRGQKGFTL